jgi:hypothetical protein
MSSVTRQLLTGSSKFETGAVTGLLERRKLCLRSANLREAPHPAWPRRTVLTAGYAPNDTSSKEGRVQDSQWKDGWTASKVEGGRNTGSGDDAERGYLVRQWTTWRRGEQHARKRKLKHERRHSNGGARGCSEAHVEPCQILDRLM